jgi:predicted NBD/HSP70 family sugar kinase
MTYYAGLDVSLRSTHICVIDDDGEPKLRTSMPSSTISMSRSLR